MLSGGSMSTSSQGNIFILSDIAGTDSFKIQDADRSTIFKVDSLGNYGGRGKIQRPTD